MPEAFLLADSCKSNTHDDLVEWVASGPSANPCNYYKTVSEKTNHAGLFGEAGVTT
jgi:hypothetical protein